MGTFRENANLTASVLNKARRKKLKTFTQRNFSKRSQKHPVLTFPRQIPNYKHRSVPNKLRKTNDGANSTNTTLSTAALPQPGLMMHSAYKPNVPKLCISLFCKTILISDNNMPRSITEVRPASFCTTRHAGSLGILNAFSLAVQGSLVMPVIYIFPSPLIYNLSSPASLNLDCLGCLGLIKRWGFSLDRPPTSRSWVLYILQLAPDVLITFKMGKLREFLPFKDIYSGSSSHTVIRCYVK